MSCRCDNDGWLWLEVFFGILFCVIFAFVWVDSKFNPVDWQARCSEASIELNVETKYDGECFVNIGNNKWQPIAKYRESGIIAGDNK
jgi:hypothetical protein